MEERVKERQANMGQQVNVNSNAKNSDAQPAYQLPNSDAFRIIFSTLNKLIGSREVSAQEAILDAIGHPLIMYSREFVNIAVVERDDVRLHFKPAKVRENLPADASGYDIFYHTNVYKYVFSMFVID
jgi:hypothetical protein